MSKEEMKFEIIKEFIPVIINTIVEKELSIEEILNAIIIICELIDIDEKVKVEKNGVIRNGFNKGGVINVG